jgi:hypothetical protein
MLNKQEIYKKLWVESPKQKAKRFVSDNALSFNLQLSA